MQKKITYWLTDHPVILNFRWSQTQSWGSTWYFLFTAIATYIVAATFLHLFLKLILNQRRSIHLGPIPVIHSLAMTLISVVTFIGMLLSAEAEVRETRWFWRRTKTVTTPFQWLLCFPLGTRSSGRVFFWSYVFYLSRFLHLQRTFFTILQSRKLTLFHLFNQSFLILKSFLWLEFSQSCQILGILFTTLLYSVVYGYRFWTAIGMPSACFSIVENLRVSLLGFNLICHIGVLLLHFLKGGCNGIGAWVFNSVLNCFNLLLFLNFYVKMQFNKAENENENENKNENSVLERKDGELLIHKEKHR